MSDIQNLKELLVFFNILDNIPNPIKKSNAEPSNTKIPVILSADDNYSRFVATTGVSILYNTNAFIEFYILSDGITQKNKDLIEKSFRAVSQNFSIKFADVNAEKEFSQIKLQENSHVKLNTCNRLLFPNLFPEVDRAIYLDVDLIVADDIEKLWNEDLDGHIIGAVPLYIYRNSTVSSFKRLANIPQNNKHFYLNSGVLLIDYKKWREVKGSNIEIIEDLFNILADVAAKITPDEIILNKFCYINGGYKILPLKYNVSPSYYSYNYLLKQKKLSEYEMATLNDYEELIEYYNYRNYIFLDSKPIVIHYFGSSKPWSSIYGANFSIPKIGGIEEFWFYAKMTLFFNDIKNDFLYRYLVDKKEEKLKFYSNFLQRIFSVKNQSIHNKNFKVITIMGLKIKIKRSMN